MTNTDTPKLPSEVLHPFAARNIDTDKTCFAYEKAEVDRYLLYYKDAVDARERALRDEIARLKTGSGSGHLWLVNYMGTHPDGKQSLGYCCITSDKTGEALMKEAYEACEGRNPPETSLIICSMSDLGESVEPANTYSDVVNREG